MMMNPIPIGDEVKVRWIYRTNDSHEVIQGTLVWTTEHLWYIKVPTEPVKFIAINTRCSTLKSIEQVKNAADRG